jgi:hypothetical protein
MQSSNKDFAYNLLLLIQLYKNMWKQKSECQECLEYFIILLLFNGYCCTSRLQRYDDLKINTGEKHKSSTLQQWTLESCCSSIYKIKILFRTCCLRSPVAQAHRGHRCEGLLSWKATRSLRPHFSLAKLIICDYAVQTKRTAQRA